MADSSFSSAFTSEEDTVMSRRVVVEAKSQWEKWETEEKRVVEDKRVAEEEKVVEDEMEAESMVPGTYYSARSSLAPTA